MEIKDVKVIGKGSLKLVFSIYFPQLDVTVRDFKLMAGKNGDWVSSPSREYQDPEGKKKYFAFFVVGDKRKEGFQKSCIEALQSFLVVPASTTQEPSIKDDDIPF
jgi:DNA-binding cell septation regulator SpoVG